MIQVQGLHHVSLVVTDLAQARQFYSKVLGLIEIERPAFDFPGAWYAVGEGQLHLIVHPRAQRTVGPQIFLTDPDGNVIELNSEVV
jgi:catechol 2,3-dioxygenase-like lactoylglutathione lyase family enzyme